MVRKFAVLLFLLASTSFANAACLAPDPAGSGHVLRVRTDEARGRVWILATDGLYVHEPASGRMQRFRLRGWMHLGRPHACPPDLVVEARGTVIASSNIVPRLWRVDPERARAEELELQIGAEAARDIGFTALEMVGPDLIVARSAIDQSAWRIDLPALRAWRQEPRR
jgi:hypothetical protein